MRNYTIKLNEEFRKFKKENPNADITFMEFKFDYNKKLREKERKIQKEYYRKNRDKIRKLEKLGKIAHD